MAEGSVMRVTEPCRLERGRFEVLRPGKRGHRSLRVGEGMAGFAPRLRAAFEAWAVLTRRSGTGEVDEKPSKLGTLVEFGRLNVHTL